LLSHQSEYLCLVRYKRDSAELYDFGLDLEQLCKYRGRFVQSAGFGGEQWPTDVYMQGAAERHLWKLELPEQLR
jgi:hypothetical protein